MKHDSIDSIHEHLQSLNLFKNTTNKLKEVLHKYGRIDEIGKELSVVEALLGYLVELIPLAINGKQLLHAKKEVLLNLRASISRDLPTDLEVKVNSLQRLFVELWFSAMLSILKVDEDTISYFITKISSYSNMHELSETICEALEEPIKSLEELKKSSDEFWQKTLELDAHLGSHIVKTLVKKLLTHRDLKDLKSFIEAYYHDISRKLIDISRIAEKLMDSQKRFMSIISNIPKRCDAFNSPIIRFLCSRLISEEERLAEVFDIKRLKEEVLGKDHIDEILMLLGNVQKEMEKACNDIQGYKEAVKQQILRLLEKAGLQPPYYVELGQWLKNVDEILTRELKLDESESQVLEVVIESAGTGKTLSIDDVVERLKLPPIEVLKSIHNLCKRGIINCQVWL